MSRVATENRYLLLLFELAVKLKLQVRMRDCNGAKIGSRACPARQATETQPCGGFPCARWAKWNTWSPCSQTCGESEQVRVRTCIFGQIGDDGCAAKDAKEQQACKLRDCGKFTSL